MAVLELGLHTALVTAQVGTEGPHHRPIHPPRSSPRPPAPEILTIAPATPSVENCIPFGRSTCGPISSMTVLVTLTAEVELGSQPVDRTRGAGEPSWDVVGHDAIDLLHLGLCYEDAFDLP